MIINVKKNLAV